MDELWLQPSDPPPIMDTQMHILHQHYTQILLSKTS
jgi:hypothetical protein